MCKNRFTILPTLPSTSHEVAKASKVEREVHLAHVVQYSTRQSIKRFKNVLIFNSHSKQEACNKAKYSLYKIVYR